MHGLVKDSKVLLLLRARRFSLFLRTIELLSINKHVKPANFNGTPSTVFNSDSLHGHVVDRKK